MADLSPEMQAAIKDAKETAAKKLNQAAGKIVITVSGDLQTRSKNPNVVIKRGE